MRATFLTALCLHVPFFGTALAQAMDQGDASILAWQAYGRFITNYLAAGQALRKGKDYVFVSPPTEYGIPGGSPVPQAITNWALQQRADVLQVPDKPLFTTSGQKYAENLEEYLSKAAIKTMDPTPEQLAKLNDLEAKKDEALDKHLTELRRAMQQWGADSAAQAAKTPFATWARTWAPKYKDLGQKAQQARAKFLQYQREIGEDNVELKQLQTKLDKLSNEDGALDFDSSIAGLNMPCDPSDFSITVTPFPTTPIENTNPASLVYCPLYTIQGLEAASDAWYKGSNSAKTEISLSMKDLKSEDWSSMGHSTTVKQKGGGLFGIISKTKAGTTTTTEFNGWNKQFQEEVDIKLTFTGTPMVFNIGAGLWDVEARKEYPTLRDGNADPFVDAIRTVKVLMGYGLSLTMSFKNMTTWNSVSKFVEEGKSDSSLGLRIFGLQFGKGGSSSYNRSTSDIKMSTSGKMGVISLPPTAPELTFMLGAFGSRV